MQTYNVNCKLSTSIAAALFLAPEGSSIVKKLSFKKTHKRSTSHHITKANAADFVFDATKPAPEPPSNQNLVRDDIDHTLQLGLLI